MKGFVPPKEIASRVLPHATAVALWFFTAAAAAGAPPPAQSQTYTVIHSFGSGTDGAGPTGGLSTYYGGLHDPYACCLGTTGGGGEYGDGTVFRVYYEAGVWNYVLLHSFDGADGYGPQDSPLNAIGTTPLGEDGIGGDPLQRGPRLGGVRRPVQLELGRG